MKPTLILRRFALATVLAATWAATTPGAASACDPQYDPFGALVGCCKADGTAMANGASCVDPNNPCQKNHCKAPAPNGDPGTCDKNVEFTQTAGHPKCLVNGDFCQVGECYTKACTYIGNQPANGFEEYCDDNKECTDDLTCNDDAASALIPPVCERSNVAAGTSCADNPSAGTPAGECLVGECDGLGECADENAPDDTDCSGATVSDQCQPRKCTDGVCQSNGDPIDCPGDPPFCKKWVCHWDGEEPVCTSKPNTGALCDTNDWDCKEQRCTSKAKCKGFIYSTAPTPHFCDPNRFNNTSILADCIAGVCDARGDCEGLTYNDGYNGAACNDGVFCTNGSTCVEDPSGVSGACKATSVSECYSSDSACGCGPACNPMAGPPKCGCP